MGRRVGSQEQGRSREERVRSCLDLKGELRSIHLPCLSADMPPSSSQVPSWPSSCTPPARLNAVEGGKVLSFLKPSQRSQG